jgi:homoserine kinase
MPVTVTVPATSANLGPGFDCLGLALGLYNHVTFTTTSDPALQITVTGVDAHKVVADASNLVYQSAKMIFERVGKRPSGLHIHQQNSIPVGSGLGSSSTAVLAGLLGANELVGGGLSRAQILQLAVDCEGHPDNVAAALYGGLVLGVQGDQQLHIEQIQVPDLTVVVVLPDFDMLTSEARAVLPAQVSLKDAVFNASRTGLLIRALETADYDTLAMAMEDRLHQPYRIPRLPGMAQAFTAARAAGAAGVALSGAGPSLIAFAPDKHQEIGEAVTAVFAGHGLSSRTWILDIDRKGSQMTR